MFASSTLPRKIEEVNTLDVIKGWAPKIELVKFPTYHLIPPGIKHEFTLTPNLES